MGPPRSVAAGFATVSAQPRARISGPITSMLGMRPYAYLARCASRRARRACGPFEGAELWARSLHKLMSLALFGECHEERKHFMSKIFSTSTSGDPTHLGDYGDIPGMKLEIPSGAAASRAAVIFNLPQPYAEGNDFPGGNFRIMFNDAQVVEGCFTYSEKQPASTGRMPLALTTSINLVPGRLNQIEVEWAGIRGSRVHLGGSASLIAIVE